MGVCCSKCDKAIDGSKDLIFPTVRPWEVVEQAAVEEVVQQEAVDESDWERLGGGEFEQPLRDELVKCVDSRFLVELFESGGRIERMQDLPNHAFISLEDLKNFGVYKSSFMGVWEANTYEWLPIIILSYAWLGRAHPDPYAETLNVLVKALKKMARHGVIIDFTSLPQVPRTEEENESFKKGLQMFNVFYSHPHTLVFQGLKINSTLTTLYLNRNEIGDEGARCIAEGLKANSALTLLALDSNQIRFEGKRCIEEATIARPGCKIRW